MASEDPRDETTAGIGGTYDTLRRLERRLEEASQAAERLIAQAAKEAAGAAARSGSLQTPPAGWQVAGAGESSGDGAAAREPDLLSQIAQSLRELIPPELQHRIAEALREVLVALRALIDWYLERLEQRRSEPVEVQDIPII